MHRIVVADEHELFRSALRVALDNEDGLQVVAVTSAADETVSAAVRHRPHVILLGTALPGASSTASLCAELQRVEPTPAVLVLTDADDEQLLLAILDAGAIGYVTRGSRLTDLVHSVHAAIRGEACIPRRMLGGLLRELISRRRESEASGGRLSRLSNREREVLAELAAGRDGDAIAARLYISPQTVRTHIQNVLAKLEVHSRLEAANLAREHGLVPDRKESSA
jgi:DNA-binding NarL/FixJ family response regulator